MVHDNVIRFGTCSKDCYGGCVFHSTWNDFAPERKLQQVIGIKEHPFTQGVLCPKLSHREDLLYSPKRLKFPLIRQGLKGSNDFEQISLTKAWNILLGKLNQTISEYGAESILGAFYSGNSGLLSMYSPLRFFEKIGAAVTSGGICNEGGIAGLEPLFGTYSTTNPFQLNNPAAELIVIWGSNLSETNLHAYLLVKRAQQRGCKVLVIDHIRSKIASEADYFLQIFPGTDALLVQLLLSKLYSKNAFDFDFLNNYVNGMESLQVELSSINEEEMLSLIGTNWAELDPIIDLFIISQHHTIFCIGYGIQKVFYGGRTVQAIALIQIVLGNLGKPGTGIIYSQSAFNRPFYSQLYDFITEQHDFTRITEEPILNLGSVINKGKYKILFVWNFNPASSLPNQMQLRTALNQSDLYVVVLDLFLNETTMYADLVFPVKMDLEANDLILPYYIPGISLNQAGPCPYNECLSNFEFFKELSQRMNFDIELYQADTDQDLVDACIALLPDKMQDELMSSGYSLIFHADEIPYADLLFPTNNGRIHIQHQSFSFNEKIIQKFKNRVPNQILLLTPSHEYYLHSQLGSIQEKNWEDFGKIYLSSDDAHNLHFQNGDYIKVSNEFGEGYYYVEISDALKSGIGLIYSGLSHPDNLLTNANLFTSDLPEEMGHSGCYNDSFVFLDKNGES